MDAALPPPRACRSQTLPPPMGMQVMTADIDEKAIRLPCPEQLVTTLAHAKADAILTRLRAAGGAEVAEQPPPAQGEGQQEEQQQGQQGEGQQSAALLITCDQVVVHEGRILEKPESLEEARAMIEGYRAAPASTVGAVVCTDLLTGRRQEELEVRWRRRLASSPGGTS